MVLAGRRDRSRSRNADHDSGTAKDASSVALDRAIATTGYSSLILELAHSCRTATSAEALWVACLLAVYAQI